MNISYIVHTDCENDKTRLTSHSSFVNVSYIIACVTVNGSLTVCNTLLTSGILKMVSNVCREVGEVREVRFRM